MLSWICLRPPPARTGMGRPSAPAKDHANDVLGRRVNSSPLPPPYITPGRMILPSVYASPTFPRAPIPRAPPYRPPPIEVEVRFRTRTSIHTPLPREVHSSLTT